MKSNLIEYPLAADYLLGVPTYRECGFAQNLPSGFAGMLLNRTDTIEFELRQYLAGQTPTRHAVYKAIQQFTAIHGKAACLLTGHVLASIEKTLLHHEWYETMVVYQGVRFGIQTRFGIQPHLLTPTEPGGQTCEEVVQLLLHVLPLCKPQSTQTST